MLSQIIIRSYNSIPSNISSNSTQTKPLRHFSSIKLFLPLKFQIPLMIFVESLSINPELRSASNLTASTFCLKTLFSWLTHLRRVVQKRRLNLTTSYTKSALNMLPKLRQLIWIRECFIRPFLIACLKVLSL